VARILYLTQVLPYPLNTGARVRQYYVLRYLSQKHEVTLVSFVREEDKPEHSAHLKTVCADVQTTPMLRSRMRDMQAVVKGIARQQPIVIARDEIAPMKQLLTDLLARQQFDVIQADQVSMSQYGLTGHGLCRVLDLHNAMYVVTERLAENEPNTLKRLVIRREARALARYEATVCARYDRVTFVTNDDRGLIERQIQRFHVPVPSDRFMTIPICVDPGEKLPIRSVERPFRITSLGVMLWPPNAEGAAWFAREVWPAIRARHPELVFTVAGKNPPDYLTQLNGRDNIEVLGYVSDLDRLLAETAVFVVPLRAGGGMRVKILDTWCWALPMVSTTIGAEGITIRDGENILIADTPQAFGAAVQRAYTDAALNQRLRQSGRQWVEQHYDWHTVYRAWDNVYAGLLSA
jgi:glycosyltransferase involved in cell wall biosynthesis